MTDTDVAARTSFDVELDGGLEPRASIGFVLLATERVVEREMIALAPTGVGMHFTRLPRAVDIDVDGLASLADDLPGAAASLLPDGGIDVIAYACTSGSIVLGDDRAMSLIGQGAPDARATTLVTGVLRGLEALEVRRIALATPYLEELNQLEIGFLTERGFDVVSSHGLQIRDDRDIQRVTPATLKRLAHAVDRADAEAVFVSCGGVRSLEVVEELEQELGKAVVCSNQAMLWDVLRLADVTDRIVGHGRLLRL